MSNTKDFSTASIVSISTGIALCRFNEIHEAAEYLMGHPIYTHQFASKELWKDMQRTIAEQCPGVPTTIEDVTAGNYLEKLSQIEAEIGKTIKIRKGSGLTAMLPEDGLPPGKPVIKF